VLSTCGYMTVLTFSNPSHATSRVIFAIAQSAGSEHELLVKKQALDDATTFMSHVETSLHDAMEPTLGSRRIGRPRFAFYQRPSDIVIAWYKRSIFHADHV
jgi:hypothetical protein